MPHRENTFFASGFTVDLSRLVSASPVLSVVTLLAGDSDGNHGLTAAQTVPAPLQVLLVGNHEEDFCLIREILERNGCRLAADLEHARSLEEAKEWMREWPFGLVPLDPDGGDMEAVRLVAEFLHTGLSIPFILLAEDADEKAVAEIIQSGMWKCPAKSCLDCATLVRIIRTRPSTGSIAAESQAFVRVGLCGKDDSRSQSGRTGNEFPAEAHTPEATVVENPDCP